MAFSDQFPTVDVTFRSGRKQGDWAKDEVQKVQGVTSVDDSEIPRSMTLESMIMFYSNHAEGNMKELYTATAESLKEYLKLKAKT